MQMPRDIGPFHIIGIGGIGMSAIAEILVAKGYTVQGSDQKESANVKRLRAKGIRVFVGHDAVNLIGARYVVISTAVKATNPELAAARSKSLQIIRTRRYSRSPRADRSIPERSARHSTHWYHGST